MKMKKCIIYILKGLVLFVSPVISITKSALKRPFE